MSTAPSCRRDLPKTSSVISDGDEARYAAELVHHDGHLRTGPLQIPQQLSWACSRHELRRLHEAAQNHGLGFGMLQQVFSSSTPTTLSMPLRKAECEWRLFRKADRFLGRSFNEGH